MGRNISSCLNAHFAGVVNYASLIFGYSSSIRVVKRFRKLATPVEEAGTEQPETTAVLVSDTESLEESLASASSFQVAMPKAGTGFRFGSHPLCQGRIIPCSVSCGG